MYEILTNIFHLMAIAGFLYLIVWAIFNNDNGPDGYGI